MRLALAALIILVGVNLGINLSNTMTKYQDKKMNQLCQVDPSYCNIQK
jgi:hypothetical protein